MPFIDLPQLNGSVLPSFPCNPTTKSPFTEHGHKNATTNIGEFRRLARNQDFLYGVPTGKTTGLNILDIDPAAFEWERTQPIPSTRAHKTRREGTHYLFNNVPGLRNSTSKIAPGVDVRAEGGYMIWWPSTNRKIINPNTILDWPSDILQLAINSAKSATKTRKEEVATSDLPQASGSTWFKFTECIEFVSYRKSDEDIIDEIHLQLIAEVRSGVATASLGMFTVRRFSRESKYALQAAAQTIRRLENAPRPFESELNPEESRPGARNHTLNVESYSLGRIMAKGWTSPKNLIRALWRGAVLCGLVENDGPQKTIDTIVSGLKAGLENPYLDLNHGLNLPLGDL